MKIVIRIFNVLILALSAAAAVLLFTTPAFSFNSNIGLDVGTFSKFVPDSKYKNDYDVPTLLGTDVINVSIKFNVDVGGLNTMASGNREAINENILRNNVDEMITTLHEPIDLITDFSIRSVVKSTIKDEVSKQIEASKNEHATGSSAQDIMDEVGMDDEYFTNFSYSLYDASDKDDATIDSVSGVLYGQIDNALAKAEESGLVDNSGFAEEKKEDIKNNLLNVLTEMKLVNEDGSIKKISQISYIYLSSYLKEQLTNRVEQEKLDQQPGEGEQAYTDRLTRTYVFTVMPDPFYTVFSAISVSLIICLIIFTVLWVFLFVFTLIRTFTRRPWTIFGPWFWILGSLQLVLGFLLTFIAKMAIPNMNLSLGDLPIKSIAIAPRTFALIPSILFAGAIILGIVYAILRGMCKADMLEEEEEE